MSFALLLSLSTVSLSTVSCSSDSGTSDEVASFDAAAQSSADARRQTDAAANGPDAMAQSASLPGWMLEDIQPLSPQFGEVYGLNAFPDKIRVAVLVAGF